MFILPFLPVCIMAFSTKLCTIWFILRGSLTIISVVLGCIVSTIFCLALSAFACNTFLILFIKSTTLNSSSSILILSKANTLKFSKLLIIKERSSMEVCKPPTNSFCCVLRCVVSNTYNKFTIDDNGVRIWKLILPIVSSLIFAVLSPILRSTISCSLSLRSEISWILPTSIILSVSSSKNILACSATYFSVWPLVMIRCSIFCCLPSLATFSKKFSTISRSSCCT